MDSGDCTTVATQPRQLHYSNNLSKKTKKKLRFPNAPLSTFVSCAYMSPCSLCKFVLHIAIHSPLFFCGLHPRGVCIINFLVCFCGVFFFFIMCAVDVHHLASPPPPLGILCRRVKKTRLLAKNSPKTRPFLGGEFWRVFFFW